MLDDKQNIRDTPARWNYEKVGKAIANNSGNIMTVKWHQWYDVLFKAFIFKVSRCLGPHLFISL